jgi:hypothetical protein
MVIILFLIITSESVDITSTTTGSEHMEDDCASLKALPPTDISEDVTMLSTAETESDRDADEDDEEESQGSLKLSATPSSNS